MVMTVKKDSFEAATKPVEMKRNCVAAGKPRKIGDIVEMAERDFTLMVNKGWAIPHLGEPVIKKKATRKNAGK